MIRIRRKPLSPRKTVQIGEADFICLTPGSESESYLSEPIKVSAELSEGISALSLDENHGIPPEGIYETGGPLFISKIMAPTQASASITILTGPGFLPPGASTHNGFDGSDWRVRYSGSLAFAPEEFGNGWYGPSPVQPGEYHASVNPDDLDSLGPQAYSKLRPKIAVAGVFQTVAELKDVPSTIRTSMKGAADLWRSISARKDLMPRYARDKALRDWKRAPKKASEHFINHMFGWVPMVKDITDISDLVLFWSDHVAKAIRNNGQWRQRTFREEVVESEEVVFSQAGLNSTLTTPVLGTAYVLPGTSVYEVVRRRTTAIWYKGSFRQYYPEFDDSLMKGHPALATVARAIRLAGAEVNPVNVYKVMPWTWCVDWFVNVGQNLQALQDMGTDAVVSRYFYLMRHTQDLFIYRNRFQTYDGQTIELEWVAGREVKARHKGQSAFGWSLLAGGLSNKQLAILGALGMTRGSHGRNLPA